MLTYQAAPGIDVISSHTAIPGLGFVPINAFVLHGAEPILVDAGAMVDRDEFMTTLRTVIDPGDLRWIWLTHPDFDHIGALSPLLSENPRIRVITTFLTVGIMGLFDPLPMDRVYLLNPGQHLEVGDRTLHAIKPPAFDNPATTGFLDSKTGGLFTSDCFGALLQGPPPESATDLAMSDLRDGQVTWATIDSPWLHTIESDVLARRLDDFRRIDAATVFSSHLPPAPGHMLRHLITSLQAVPGAQPFSAPDQAALEQLFAQNVSGNVG
ncbi:MBL fold metallo-hydrolase [Gordonia rhizosphera]|uniref:Metallo-beta-lactamase domain-containing protein n=1 Tax=Gordonia rhizosphera NBRC 16068 TaxID=1108045 RepID=K6VPI7_9ACTN|nr:MBL fold metallo-hydrolase [Gordonia rhizosphera]GAB88785.1 hypothetical protein GORHZ_040_00180 [Gordonia rhizosphera NBRC 16068]